MKDSIEKIHTFAEKLLLGENSLLGTEQYCNELDFAIDHVHDILNSKDDYHEYYKYELRLRLAMHFSPIDAIEYDSTNDYTRKELLEEHLINNFYKNKEDASTLADAIIEIFELREDPRKGVSKYNKQLLEKQKYKCNHCNVKIIDENGIYKVNSKFMTDEYKLYRYPKKDLIGNIELLTVEVDHIKPVSSLGDNSMSNLQALCKLCNQAKSNLITLKTVDEIKFATNSLLEIKKDRPMHINRMLYFTILRANHKCEKCNRKYELTMRKIILTGPFVRSNLIAVCKTCANKIDKIH